MEYKFHLDCVIFTIVNVYQTYRFIHIQHYRDETYPLYDACYHPKHFEDHEKLLENTSQIHKLLESWSYH